MNRRHFLSTVCLAAVLPAAARAQSVTDRFVELLRSQGFSGIDVSRTLLGRTRIVARGGNRRREIIINPRTGEVLRDVMYILGDDSSSGGGGGFSGRDDDEGDDDEDDDRGDDEDDDEDDDRDDEDRSGSNSGRG